MGKMSFLRLDKKPGDDLKGSFATEADLQAILNNAYNVLKDDEAIEIHVYRDYTLVGTRKKGHGDVMTKKFINFGFSPKRYSNKTESLADAIRAIDDWELPKYCYEAINGDLEALRRTTEHLVRAYTAKIKRMKEKGKSAKEIEKFALRRDSAERRLTLPDDEFMEVSEPIIIEIPKNPDIFYSEDDVVYICSADTFFEDED